MKTSESITEIAIALCAVQSEIEPASKDGKGNYGRYLNLTSVWDSCRSALGKHHLAVIQSPAFIDGVVVVTTRLLHKSGQWVENELAIKPQQATAQGIGSAITYARRYSLASFIGVVADEDDDGKEATKGGSSADKEKKKWSGNPASHELDPPKSPLYNHYDNQHKNLMANEISKKGLNLPIEKMREWSEDAFKQKVPVDRLGDYVKLQANVSGLT